MLQEFQAVVLAAGRGSRMPEITVGKPKCLLPIGNKPLVWYPLFKLQKSGFRECILVVLENQKAEIQSILDKIGLHIKVEYFCISTEESGTADSLRLLHDRIKSDVVVLSCDLITDGNLENVLNLFRKHNASACALFFHPQASEHVPMPGPKIKYKPERDLVGIDSQTNRFVFLASASDFESHVSLPKALVKKHSNIRMYSNLIDSHIYVLKNWVLKYLQHELNISTIKGELLPHIIHKQLLKPKTTKDQNMSVINTKDKNDIFQFSKELDLEMQIREMSTFNDHYGDLKACYHNDSIRCFAYIESPDVYGVRVNTLPGYYSANAMIVDKWEILSNGEPRLNSSADIKSTQVDDKSIVWESAKLNEKTSYKNSIIGSHCEIHNFSRVFNSIVMNNVIIKERVALENCIVCDRVVIESGAQLKNCLIESSHIIGEQSVINNEVLTITDRLMEF